jgi:hypothetical protein
MTYQLNGRAAVVGGLLIWPLLLPLDSQWMAARFPGGQWLTTAATALYFIALYRGAPPRLRHALVAGVVIATAGECFFSLLAGMYEYRLHNVPFYVPPGHAILYGTVFWFSRDAGVRHRARTWQIAMYAVAAVYSVSWLFLRGDVYGWLCFAVFSAIIAIAPESRLFFLAMYLLVALLEQVGTTLGCWHWPDILLNRFSAVPSANPPSGIASFYFGLDVLCLLAYLRSRPRTATRRRRGTAQLASSRRSEDQTARVATMTLASTTGRAPMARP